jgi:serine/threonine protein kinase
LAIDPGAQLGPYEIQAALGAGGMGEVYRARDTRLGRVVAIKVLPASMAGDPQRRERFEREARAISSLNHPHICTVYDVGHDEGTDYLVMELLEGQTLEARLQRGALPLDQALRHAIEIADALSAAHRRGLVHRDLKPANIFLVRSELSGAPAAKLLDFGIAKAIAAPDLPAITAQATLTTEGALIGTLQYMAPEQLEGREADARSDLFAFGALVYEMLTGRRAFAGETQSRVIAAVLDSEPPTLAAMQPLTPPALEHVVTTCLAKNPDQRWQSASDVKRQLEWIAASARSTVAPTNGGSPVLDGATPALLREQRPDRHWWIIAAIAGVVLVSVLVPIAARMRGQSAIGPTMRFEIQVPCLAIFQWALARLHHRRIRYEPDRGSTVPGDQGRDLAGAGRRWERTDMAR